MTRRTKDVQKVRRDTSSINLNERHVVMVSTDRQRGTLLGLAIGDALGAAVEFKPPGTFPEVTGYRGGGPTAWLRASGPTIPAWPWPWPTASPAPAGISTTKPAAISPGGGRANTRSTTAASTSASRRSTALRRFEKTSDAKTSGDPSERASGNGSIMRLAPVPIRYADLFPDDLEELVRCLIESSLPTHASPQCLSACAYMGLVLCGLIHGIDRQEVLAPNGSRCSNCKRVHALHPEVAEVAAGSFRQKQPPEIVGSGYVVKSLEAALWAFHDAEDFREAVLRAVNLGDDADTTGAVCGQLAGAYWGESGIPREWRDGLARPEMIEKALQGLLGMQG